MCLAKTCNLVYCASMPTNPNEYDDAKYTENVNELNNVVANLWEAGASEDEIKNECANALDNAVTQ